jgi:hypothetical protein
MEWLLEIVLVLLLAATLFHALRLERALGVLKRDRAALEALIAEFNASTQAAEQGVERLHNAAEGAGRQIARHTEAGTRLKDDLVFLTERGGKLADRLDHLVRAARGLDLPDTRPPAPEPQSWQPPPPTRPSPAPQFLSTAAAEPPPEPAPEEPAPRLRSQAERDLLRALRLTR